MKQSQNFKFSLGEKVKEKITGFEGVVMSQAAYISGCTQYGVMSTELDTEGASKSWIYYDENRLASLGSKIELDEDEEEEPETPIGGEDIHVNMDKNYPRTS